MSVISRAEGWGVGSPAASQAAGASVSQNAAILSEVTSVVAFPTVTHALRGHLPWCLWRLLASLSLWQDKCPPSVLGDTVESS